MSTDLTTTPKLKSIITKINSDFKVITDEKLNQIALMMPEMDRALTAFGKTNSQTTASLMTLTMLESGPYRVLRQILAQIENKRAALKEALYNHEKNKIKRDKLLKELGQTSDELRIKEINLDIAKIEYDLADSINYIEAALKEIGAYQKRYKEVMKNNNIPENWDESDFEEAEIEHHIKSIFRNGVRDRLQGSHNMGTMEYMEQFGINPIVAYKLIDDYIATIRGSITDTQAPDIGAHYDFYDRMYELFKNEYKKAAKRIGLDHITQSEFLMRENK